MSRRCCSPSWSSGKMIFPPAGSRNLTSAWCVPENSPSTTACSEGSVKVEVVPFKPPDEELCQEPTSLESTRSWSSTAVSWCPACTRERLAKTSADEPSSWPPESTGTSKLSVIGVGSACQPESVELAKVVLLLVLQLAVKNSFVAVASVVSCRIRGPDRGDGIS